MIVESKEKTNRLKHILWWLLLSLGLLALLSYGLSSFLAKPSIETITTHAPSFNANSNMMRDAKYSRRK